MIEAGIRPRNLGRRLAATAFPIRRDSCIAPVCSIDSSSRVDREADRIVESRIGATNAPGRLLIAGCTGWKYQHIMKLCRGVDIVVRIERKPLTPKLPDFASKSGITFGHPSVRETSFRG
jgi:hypothetical protein